jgi:FMN-dependent NADH-azoreductase
MRLLNIESSPRGLKSASIVISNAFIEAYRKVCPEEVLVDTLNVWDEKLPDFDQEAIGAKYKGVNMEPMDPAERAVWDKIQELAARFQRADRIVLGVPMWNFAYPYKLKQLIDLSSQRNMLFTFDGENYGPLLKTPRALVVYARGGIYREDSVTPASHFDHQKGYFDFWLNFVGVKEVRSLNQEELRPLSHDGSNGMPYVAHLPRGTDLQAGERHGTCGFLRRSICGRRNLR